MLLRPKFIPRPKGAGLSFGQVICKLSNIVHGFSFYTRYSEYSDFNCCHFFRLSRHHKRLGSVLFYIVINKFYNIYICMNSVFMHIYYKTGHEYYAGTSSTITLLDTINRRPLVFSE